MSNLPTLLLRAQDDNGTAIASAKLYSYIAGTSTAKATYPTAADAAAGTNANANPMVAASNGYFGECYLVEGAPYKFILKNASDVTLYTVDNIYGTASTANAELEDYLPENPVKYGALGDGVANETTYVQSAITAAVAGTLHVDLLGGTYRVDGTLSYTGKVTIRNGYFTHTNSTEATYHSIAGTVGSQINLSANAAHLATAFTATSSGAISSGDYVAIASGADYLNLTQQGEVIEILSVSGTTHNLKTPLRDAYNTANTAYVKKFTPVADVCFEDVGFVGSVVASGAETFIRGTNCLRLTFRRCRFVGMKVHAVLLSGAIDTVFEDCTFENVTSSATARGITLANTVNENTRIERCIFRNMTDAGVIVDDAVTTATAVEGVTHNTHVVDCTFKGSTLPFTSSSGTRGFYVSGCRVLGNTDNEFNGQDTDCRDNIWEGDTHQTLGPVSCPNKSGRNFFFRFCNNSFVAGAEATLSLSSAATTGGGGTFWDVDYSGNRAVGTTLGLGLALSNTATGFSINRLTLSGNSETNADYSLSTTTTPTIDRLEVLNNRFRSLTITGSAGLIERTIVRGNTVGGAALKLLDISTDGHVTVSDNQLEGDGSTTTKGLELSSPTQMSICGNVVSGIVSGGTGLAVDLLATDGLINDNHITSTGYGITVSNTAVSWDGLVISGNAVTAGDTGIGVGSTTASFDTVIEGNTVSSAGGTNEHCLHLQGILTGGVIANNMLDRGNDDDSNIHLEATSSGDISGFGIRGNRFRNGTYGIEVTNGVGTLRQYANVFNSILTLSTLGILPQGKSSGTTSTSITGAEATFDNGASLVIPANSLAVGTVIRIVAWGAFTYDADSNGVPAAGIRLGPTATAVGSRASLLAVQLTDEADAGELWQLRLDCVVRTLGTAATAVISTGGLRSKSLDADPGNTENQGGPTTTVFDTTVEQTLSVTGTGADTAADAALCYGFTFEFFTPDQ